MVSERSLCLEIYISPCCASLELRIYIPSVSYFPPRPFSHSISFGPRTFIASSFSTGYEPGYRLASSRSLQSKSSSNHHSNPRIDRSHESSNRCFSQIPNSAIKDRTASTNPYRPPKTKTGSLDPPETILCQSAKR